MNFRGTQHDDDLDGTAGNDRFNMAQGGDDTVSGGGGNDSFAYGKWLTSADHIDGGTGRDSVVLAGDYTGAHTLVFAADTMINVEILSLRAGFGYDITTDDATVAGMALLHVNGGTLGAGNALTFDGSAETDGRFMIAAGAGDDHLTGGARNDSFDLTTGGNDTASGGAGADSFTLGAAMTASDAIEGGLGDDAVVLFGNYTGGNALVFTATTMTGIETLALGGGSSYAITTADATVAAHKTLTINAIGLGAGNTLTFDGSQESDGSFTVIAGADDDHLTGGGGGDTFFLTRGGNDTALGGGGSDVFAIGGALTASDHIDGGDGSDTLMLAGDYTGANALVFAAGTVVNVENFTLAAGVSYDITFNNANTALNKGYTIDASALGAGDTLRLDLSHELDSRYTVLGGAGDDVIVGGGPKLTYNLSTGGEDTASAGGGGDTFVMGAALSAGDRLDGKGGYDLLDLTGNYNGVDLGAAFVNVETLLLHGGGFVYDLVLGNANIAAGQTLGIFADGDARMLIDGSAETDGHFVFFASGSNNTLLGGALSDQFEFTANFSAGDTIDGGSGADMLELTGDYAVLALAAPAVQSIETVLFGSGHDYSNIVVTGDIAGGAQLYLNGSALGSGDAFNADLSAATSSSYRIWGSDAGNTFTFGGNLHPGDVLYGDSGNDTLVLTQGLNINLSTAIASIETIKLTDADGTYDLTMGEANVPLQQTLTVDASALTDPSSSFSFDGRAETNGYFLIKAGAGDDVIASGMGADTITGGAGSDTFVYSSASQSLAGASNMDAITDFDANADVFRLPFVVTYDGETSGFVAHPQQDLAVLVNPLLTAHGAVLVDASSGSQHGHVYLVVDFDGNGTYNWQTDLTIDMTGMANQASFGSGDFVT